MGSLSYSIKKYFTFSHTEINNILISTIFLAFIISFSEWGGEVFSLYTGLFNLTLSFLIVGLSLIAHLAVQRVVGITSGFKVEYAIWWYGLLIGLVLIFVSNGKLWFLAPGGVIVYHMAGHRLGDFRYGLNYWPLGLTGLSGPMTNLILAFIFKIFFTIFPESAIFFKLMTFNIWFAIFTMLPIPPLDGSHLFFASRVFYIFSFSLIVAITLFLYLFSLTVAIFAGLIIAVICWLLYLWFGELT